MQAATQLPSTCVRQPYVEYCYLLDYELPELTSDLVPPVQGFVGRALGDPGLKPTVRVGEAAMREVAAYLLDHEHFARVPATALVKVGRPGPQVQCAVCALLLCISQDRSARAVEGRGDSLSRGCEGYVQLTHVCCCG